MIDEVSAEKILGFKSPNRLMTLTARQLAGRLLSHEEIAHMLKLLDGLWLYPNLSQPSAAIPHAQCRGRCLTGYARPYAALQYDNIRRIFAQQLYKLLRLSRPLMQVDWIIVHDGDDETAMRLGEDICRLVGKGCQLAATQLGANGTATWRGKIGHGKSILQVGRQIDDLKAMRQAIRLDDPTENLTFLPVSLALVHLGEMTSLEGEPFKVLIHLPEVKLFSPSDCPLCQAGSKAIHPEHPGNWHQLLKSQ